VPVLVLGLAEMERAGVRAVHLTKRAWFQNNARMDVSAGQLDSLKWDSNGLVPAIIQDHRTGEVLAMFWMNRAALEKTIETGKVHSYSRSRGRLAMKGETSGHVEHVKSISTDCDRDVVLVRVEQVGAACHEGYYSCFYREYQPGAGEWKVVGRRVFDPEKVYAKH